jgi:repressor LexA
MTMDEVAQKVGVAKSTIQRYETGQIGKVKLPVIESIAAALLVNPDWLIGNTDDPRPKRSFENGVFPDNILPMPGMREWKVLGATACGDPLYRELEGETVIAPDNIDADFVFRCDGDSMIGARILDGDIVFVKAGNVENGQIAVVRIGEEYTLKRIYRGEDYLELRAENPAYPPRIIRGDQENAEIVGRAVHFLSRVI